MIRQAEAKAAPDPFIEHSKKTIAALVTGALATTFMIAYFSLQHLLPMDLPNFHPIETTARMLTPLVLGILESSRQNYLANRALVNGTKNASEIGLV